MPDHGNHQNHVSLNGKQVACANGKGIQRTLKMIQQSIPKSMQNRYKIHIRKSDANKSENHPKWKPKGSQ